MIAITLALSFINSIMYEFIIFPLMCILAGLVTMRILNKIDAVTTPTLTSTHTWIFAAYSTIITTIIVIITQILVNLNDSMSRLYSDINDVGAVGSPGITLSIFGNVHPIYTAIVAFIGLNLTYIYYYYKHPEKSWKDFLPHLCGIMFIVGVYLIDVGRILTG